MDIIFLCGAGGTGKSSVTREMANLLADHKWPQFPLKVMQSTSRRTYERLGLKSETVALNSDINTQVTLQREIMVDHLAEIKACASVLAGKRNPVLVVDRSPLDHLAYWLRTAVKNPEAVLNDFYTGLNEIKNCLIETGAERSLWVQFQYPVPWSTDDGARDQNRLKTLEIQFTSETCVRKHHKILKKNKLMELPLEGTPRDRALSILHTLEHWDN